MPNTKNARTQTVPKRLPRIPYVAIWDDDNDKPGDAERRRDAINAEYLRVWKIENGQE